MGKRIVFCSDGTWQAAMAGSNVYRLYKALTVSADQVTLYDDGVGADATGFERLLDGLIGGQLVEKVRNGYTKIAHLYEAGDEIFLFGFSRGAYTVRSLAGMIAGCGLPTGTFDDACVTQVFAAYRDPVNRAALLGELVGCGLGDASIRMIGAWDTVGSLGIPAIFGGIDQAHYGFLDTGLHPDVRNAYHAMALDEMRPQFPATLWTSEAASGQTIEQVWFSGCHCDVGGGTSLAGDVDGGTRLCDITLGWMAGKAQALGLTMDPEVAAHFAELPGKYALDAIRETWGARDGSPHHRLVEDDALVGNSVGLRLEYALTYAPENLKMVERALASGYAAVEVVDQKAL